MNWPLAHVEKRLAEHRAKEHSRILSPQRAAVAALLRFEGASAEVLLMERVARKGDRWSGHISFPGGREEEQDADLLATAIRETREEVGIELDRSARLLGRLDDIRAIAKGRFLPMSITPFVFVQEKAESITLGDEAVDTVWLPLELAASGDLDGTYPYQLGPARMALPCWRYQGKVIWGLTYRMIENLIEILRGDSP